MVFSKPKEVENSSTIILVLYSTDLQNETETIISRIREIVYGKYGVELIAGIGEITNAGR